jgi:hypothetical protein
MVQNIQTNKMKLQEVISKYGEVKLSFDFYHKHAFKFEGTAPDGTDISAYCGGDAQSIFNKEIFNDSTDTLGNIIGKWYYVQLVNQQSEVIFELEDFSK